MKICDYRIKPYAHFLKTNVFIKANKNAIIFTVDNIHIIFETAG